MKGIFHEFSITEEEIIEYCKKNLYPNEVFSEKELSQWALDNGYIQKEE